MKQLLFPVLAVLLSANLYADTDRDVYDEADQIFKQAEEAVSTNLATFVQANEKPLAKAREEMAELIARMNKEGRSQLATSLQKRLNGLEGTVQKRVRSEGPIMVAPKKPTLERMQGKWSAKRSFSYQIDDKGVFHEIYTDTGKEKGFGQLNEIAPGVAKVRVNHGWQFVLTLADDNVLTLVSCNPSGRPEIIDVLQREMP